MAIKKNHFTWVYTHLFKADFVTCLLAKKGNTLKMWRKMLLLGKRLVYTPSLTFAKSSRKNGQKRQHFPHAKQNKLAWAV